MGLTITATCDVCGEEVEIQDATILDEDCNEELQGGAQECDECGTKLNKDDVAYCETCYDEKKVGDCMLCGTDMETDDTKFCAGCLKEAEESAFKKGREEGIEIGYMEARSDFLSTLQYVVDCMKYETFGQIPTENPNKKNY